MCEYVDHRLFGADVATAAGCVQQRADAGFRQVNAVERGH